MKAIGYIVHLIWWLGLAFLLLSSCTDEGGPQSLPPDVSVLPAENVTRTSARIRGSVIPNASGIVEQKYFVYGISAEESAMLRVPDAFMKCDSAHSNLWYADLADLLPATRYYYRLYAGNKHSTVVSETGQFVTLPNVKASLTELTILNQGPLSVICSFSVTDNGGSNISDVGCYLHSADETKVKFPAESVSVGKYRMRIGALRPYTSYALSAYAVNAEGETETTSVSFTTGDAIELSEVGTLSDVLDAEAMKYYAEHGCSFSIVGEMNGDDIYALRTLLAEFSDTEGGWNLNLTDATISSGGRTYGYGRFTENDVIGYGMFGGCALQSITLPDNVVRVEQNAFIDCPHLIDIVISANTSEVLPSDGCVALERIEVSPANDSFTSLDGVLYNSDMTSLVWFPLGKNGAYTLPQSVASISDYALRGCSISSFTIPEGIKEMGQGALCDSKVQSVSLPSTLRAIPTSAFQNCQNLTTVRMGTGTELISDYAFDGCPLTQIYIDATIPPVCSATAFSSYDATVYVPASSIGVYRNHKVWGKFKLSAK